MSNDPSKSLFISDKLDFNIIIDIITHLKKYTNRIAGTKQIIEACLYIKEFLDDLTGVHAWVDKFPIYTSFPIESEVRIVHPIQKAIESFPNLYSLNTDGQIGEVVYVNAGDKTDYKNKKVEGKIVLADLSYAPPRPEKAWIAKNKGAKALILSNWGHPENKIVGRGAIKHRWGPLLLTDLEYIPRIPSVNIARKDAEDIKNILSKDDVTINVKCKVEDKWVLSNQPMCRITPLKRNFDELLVVGGHLEAWGGTVTDNSAGNAIILEIARTLSKNRKKIHREVILGFWDGHEIGEAAGSGWFVDNQWRTLNDLGIAYLNIDGCGMKGTSNFISYSSPETWSFLGEVEMDIIGKKSEKKLPLKIGDNSFLGIGLPYIFTFTTYNQLELEKKGNAIFGWWYHSEEDSFDKLDQDLLHLQSELYFEYISRLLILPIIPWNYEAFATYVIQEFTEIEKNFGDIPYLERLKDIRDRVEVFKRRAIILNELIEQYSIKNYTDYNEKDKETIRKINKLIILLGRYLNPAFRSTTDKYNHDPYGYTILAKPLPRIYKVLDELRGYKKDDFDYFCLINQLIRQYNILEDTINIVIYLIDNALTTINSRGI